jgi:hypothetical protein
LDKGGATWEHAQGVDPSSLGNMGTPYRLEDPINTPMRSHDDWHGITHKERGTHPRMGLAILRYMMVDECAGLDGHTGSMEGHDNLFECGFMKGRDTPKIHVVSHK